jgi:hypothetical protein
MNMRIILNDFVWKRKWWVMYLIVNDKVRIDEKLNAQVEKFMDGVALKHVRAYMDDGTMPPEAIAPAILNMADDVMAGRQVSLRAGDYIAIQNFARSTK